MKRHSFDYFTEDNLQSDLRAKTVRGGAFTAIAQSIQVGIQLVTISILGRLLDPADFGLVAMVAVVTGFANMFVDAGLSMATVQRSRITHQQVTNLFWLAAGLGVLVAASVAALTPIIAWFYNEPRLVPITLVLSLSLLLAGITIQPQALLQRAMRFRAISAIQVSSVLTGQIVAVAWAWSYRDYWALVFMPVATTLVRASATWIVCGWWPGLPRRRSNVTPLIGFGLYLTGMNVVNYLARNVDYVLIGWYWGESLLGFYERAYKLLMFPLQQLNAPMSAVALPALSRLKNEPERYRSFWRKGCLIAAMIQIPIVMVAAINSQELVRILLGPGWDVSVSTFRALIPAMLLTFTAPATTWVFVSWGRPDKQLRLALVSTVITITGFAVSLPFGIVAMAWTFSCMQVAVRPFAIAYCFHGTPLRWTDFWQGVSLPATAALTALPVYMVINWSLPTLDSDIARFALKSVLFLGVFVLVTLTMASGRQFVRELIVMISQSTSRTAGNKTVIT